MVSVYGNSSIACLSKGFRFFAAATFAGELTHGLEDNEQHNVGERNPVNARHERHHVLEEQKVEYHPQVVRSQVRQHVYPRQYQRRPHKRVSAAIGVEFFVGFGEYRIENKGEEVHGVEAVPERRNDIREVKCDFPIDDAVHAEVKVAFEPHVSVVVPPLGHPHGEDA